MNELRPLVCKQHRRTDRTREGSIGVQTKARKICIGFGWVRSVVWREFDNFGADFNLARYGDQRIDIDPFAFYIDHSLDRNSPRFSKKCNACYRESISRGRRKYDRRGT